MLEIKNLNVSVNGKQIVKNADATFEGGKITCILGANGCGKTTILRAIDGLIKSEGAVTYNGNDVLKMTIKERARIIAFLPQKRPTLHIEGGLLIEHGRFPYMNFMKKADEDDIRAIDKAIELTGTEDLVNKSLSRMSGGEQQRIYIACALAQETDILLLDEPTTHLDLQSQISIMQLMQKLKDAGKTVIVVLHDLAQAFSTADSIILMKDGEIVASGTPEELSNGGKIKEVFGFDIVKDETEDALYSYKLLNLPKED